jgi:hypothetical protein
MSESDAAMSPVAQSSPRILLRTTAVIIVSAAVVVASIAGILASYYLSVDIAQSSLLALAATLTFAAIASECELASCFGGLTRPCASLR